MDKPLWSVAKSQYPGRGKYEMVAFSLRYANILDFINSENRWNKKIAGSDECSTKAYSL